MLQYVIHYTFNKQDRTTQQIPASRSQPPYLIHEMGHSITIINGREDSSKGPKQERWKKGGRPPAKKPTKNNFKRCITLKRNSTAVNKIKRMRNSKQIKQMWNMNLKILKPILSCRTNVLDLIGPQKDCS